jgi:hypothetical protein
LKIHQTGGDALHESPHRSGGAAEFYLQMADECRRAAQVAIDPDKRDQWLDMANQWARLSLDTKRRGPNHQ